MPTLNWIGKQAVEKHHLEIPYKLLEYDESLSAGDQESDNLLVQGDNLHALKALLPYYAGKVKCIYIDPPYNTGNESWRYNDNVNSPEIKEWLIDAVGPEGEDLSRHDKWLCMMYPRLQMLKKLLSKDGAIFISIDDTEQGNLRLLLDEIFGNHNFVANIIWQKKFSPQNDAKYFSDNHDFIVCYAKRKDIWRRNLLPRTEKMDSRYKNPDNDPRGDWTSGDLSVKTYTPSTDYPITTPSGRIVNPPQGYCWRVSRAKLAELIAENRIWFGREGNNVPRIKRFITDVQTGIVPLTIWLHNEVGHNQQASQDLKSLFPESAFPFETPKPKTLIKRILQIASLKNSLVLDSFSGSGTTGQAVLDLNNEDGGNRKFILVELKEDISKNVTAERLKRVINGYSIAKSNNTTEQIEGLGSGFRYCKLGEPLFDRYGNVRAGVKFNELARHIFFSETGNPISEKAKLNTPKIGIYKGTAYYLLFNGILGDKTINGGNVLTSKVLENLPKHNGLKIVFGEANRLGAEKLKRENIVFKQIPYEIKTV
jgi:site-specific DNA-methyltransferase (adenine-specific)/adenine-specific DNA-methyltransferase